MKTVYVLVLLCSTMLLKAQQTHFLWAAPFQGNGSEYGIASQPDAAGNIYVTGFFEDSVWFEPGNQATRVIATGLWFSDCYIAKYNAQGKVMWVKSFGGPLIDQTHRMTINAAGQLILCGEFNSQVDFDPGIGTQLRSSAGGSDGFILTLDSNGTYVNVLTYGGAGYDRIMDVCVQGQDLFAIGDFQQTVDFDPQGSHAYRNALGESDICILKLTQQGNYVWMKQISGKHSEYGLNIVADEFGTIYCAGNFEDTVDFNPSSSAVQQLIAYPAISLNGNPFDSYLLALSNNGDFSWVKQIGGYEDQQVGALLYHQQKLYVGVNYNSLSFGNLPSTNTFSVNTAGEYDFFLETFTPSGTPLELISWGGNESDHINCIQTDVEKNIYLTGFFAATCDFNPDPLQSEILQVNSFDGNAFLLKLNPNHQFQWVKQWVGDAFSQITQTWVNADRSIYSIGHWTSTVDMDPDAGTDNRSTKLYYDGFVHKMSQCDPVDSFYQITACDSFNFHGQHFTQSGDYTLPVLSPDHCDTTFHLHLNLEQTQKPELVITPKSCGLANDGALDIVSFNSSYQYQLVPGNHTLNGNRYDLLAAQSYTLWIQEQNGCKHKESIIIPEANCCDAPWIPSAFSPNKDGLNDELRIMNLSEASVKQFVIYNRFGNEVFNNMALWGWDGNYHNEPVEIGTYFYYLRYICNQSGKNHTLKGSFELIR